jgi:hypothetical protein
MLITFLVSAVKGGVFLTEEKEEREYGYVYATGDFRNNRDGKNINTGVQVQKFRCPDLKVLSAIADRLAQAGQPVSLPLDLDFTAKEGEVSRPVILGLGK